MSATVPYGNTTASQISESTYQGRLVTDYTVTTDSPTKVVLGNRTGSANQSYDIQILDYQKLKSGVTKPDELTIDNPTRSRVARSVTIADWTVVTEPATELKAAEDFPVCFSLQIRSHLVSTIDNDVLNELWKHFLSSLQRNADGTVDFRSYLLGALKPTKDNVEPT